MLISVCIPALRATTLKSAIDSIRCQTWVTWELVVVGQGKDSSLRALVEDMSRYDDRVHYIHLMQTGLSRARNAGVASSTGNVVAMTDDDCVAHPQWLETLADYFIADPEVGLVGGALVKPHHARRALSSCPSLAPAEALYDPVASRRLAPRGWDWLGGNFALRRSTIEHVGPFDEYLGAGTRFPSAEDTDYKLRLEALGVKMRSTPRAIVYHTYGTRYGLRAGLRHSRNYARGNGAMAGKLTLLDDPRGREWLEATMRECTVDWLFRMRPHRLPVSILRLWHFKNAYEQCLKGYKVDSKLGVLYPVDMASS